MNTDAFWSIVDQAKSNDTIENRCSRLKSILQELKTVDLKSFATNFQDCSNKAFRWDIWGAACIMNGGCSDDGFHYFCSWLIFQRLIWLKMRGTSMLLWIY